MGKRDDVLIGHGQLGGVLPGHCQRRWCTDDMGRRDGIVTGHGQKRWCTDWPGEEDMVYSLDTVGEVVY